jgi:phage terminase small subunit
MTAEKQKAFARSYARGADAAVAALDAGYTGNLRVAAKRLLSNPRVILLIAKERVIPFENRSEVQIASHIAPLREVIRVASNQVKVLGVSEFTLTLDGWSVSFKKEKR